MNFCVPFEYNTTPMGLRALGSVPISRHSTRMDAPQKVGTPTRALLAHPYRGLFPPLFLFYISSNDVPFEEKEIQEGYLDKLFPGLGHHT